MSSPRLYHFAVNWEPMPRSALTEQWMVSVGANTKIGSVAL